MEKIDANCKSVLISIRPNWCAKIANEDKTLEVRKTRPKIQTPFKCYIYCTLPPKDELFTHGGIHEYANELIKRQDGAVVYGYGMQLVCNKRPYSKDNFLCKKVIGEFVCDEIYNIVRCGCAYIIPNNDTALTNRVAKMSRLLFDDMKSYLGDKAGYGCQIVDGIYDITADKIDELEKKGLQLAKGYNARLYTSEEMKKRLDHIKEYCNKVKGE